MLVYVDDIIITGSNSSLVLKVISAMQHIHALKDIHMHLRIWDFPGIQVTKTEKGIHLSQAKYITGLLAKQNMDKCNPCTTPMASSHHLIQNSSIVIDNGS